MWISQHLSISVNVLHSSIRAGVSIPGVLGSDEFSDSSYSPVVHPLIDDDMSRMAMTILPSIFVVYFLFLKPLLAIPSTRIPRVTDTTFDNK